MSDPDVFLEAVRGVEHGMGCQADARPGYERLCSCHEWRDKRLAKGLERAVEALVVYATGYEKQVEYALRMFTEASRG